MKRFNLAIAAVAAACVVFLAACGGSTPQAEQAAINEINKKWQEAIVAKDAKAIAAIYAQDGQMLPPNTAKVAGREGIEKSWGELVGTPGFSLTFETQDFTVAKSGDVAVEVQTYKLTMGEGAAAVTEIGKGVVTWVKRDGKWVVLTDMFSSDSAPPVQAAAAPAPAESALDAAAGAAATEGAMTATPDGASAAPAAGTPAPVTPASAKPPGQ
jgi:uncharacterized protein (TIGR02246 family)